MYNRIGEKGINNNYKGKNGKKLSKSAGKSR